MKRVVLSAILTAVTVLVIASCGTGPVPVSPVKRTMDTTFVTAENCRTEKFRIFSDCMQRDIGAVVVLPPSYDADQKKRFPVLYALHGYAAPYIAWSEMTKLRKQLKDKPFILAAFDGDVGSSYIDSYFPIKTSRKRKGSQADTTKRTSKFMTFFFKEFIPGTDAWYRIDGSKRGVTGFSMGGGGAMTYMLAKPGMFCSVSGLSTAYFDFSDTLSKSKKWIAEKIGTFKEHPERYEALDHYEQLKKWKAKGVTVPPIYQHCGTEDWLLDRNRKMAKFLKENGFSITYLETEGKHNWKFWHPASVGVAEFHWKYFGK